MKSKLSYLALWNALAVLAVLGHSDTALAQNTIAFSPSTVTLSAQLGTNAPQSTNVTVTLNGLPVPSFTATSTTATGQQGGWLAVTTTVTASQSYFTVIANPQGLQANNYDGSITVTAQGVTAVLPVKFSIFSSTTLTVDQPNLTFATQVNGTAPTNQVVNVSSSTAGLPITATATTVSGGNWLAVTQSSTTAPSVLNVSVNPTGLATGTYTGTITISASQVAPATINVTLTVNAQPVITANPNPVTLLYQSGVNAPVPQQAVSIQSTSGNLAYAANITQSSCGAWLQVTSGLSGTTPAQMVLVPTLTGLSATQTCTATITITAPGASNPSLALPVTLTISPSPLLGIYPASTSFSYSVGGALPAAQPLTVSTSSSASGATPLNFSLASNVPWLLVPATPTNGFVAPTTFALSLNQAALVQMNPGTYSGSVIVTALGSGNSPLTIPVTLTISNNPLLTVTPAFATFNYQIGTTLPSPVTVGVASTMGTLPFTVTVADPVYFVTASPTSGTATTTPTPITLSVLPPVAVALPAGTYTNTVNVTAATGGTQQIQTTLNVSASPLINVAPQALSFSYAQNGALPTSQSLAVTSTSGSLPVSFTSSQTWLLVSGANPTTPSNIVVAIYPTGLNPGTYTGQITITSGTQTFTVPVTLNISSGIAIGGTPTSLSFSQATGGTVPAAQNIALTSTNSASISYSATAATTTGGSWLILNNTANTPTVSGTAPGNLAVSVNGASLQPGTYNGTVTVASVGATNSLLVIPVTLTITQSQGIATNPTSLTFNGSVAGSAPAAQTVSVTSTTGSPVSFTATAQATGGNWLSVTPSSGTTTASVTVSVNQAGLAAGTYTGTVTLAASTQGATPLTIPVTLTVGAQNKPVPTTIINAASGGQGLVAPGEIITIFGSGLGPASAAGLMLTQSGTVATTVAQVTVTFDGVAAPLTYVSSTQINCVVPYEVSGKTTSQMVVSFNGLASAATTVGIGATSPGLFTLNASGTGPAAVLNQNSSLNSASNAAAKGSTIVIFATGEGIGAPAVATGTVIGTTLSKPAATISVTVGGVPATVAYAGSAPGNVAGVFQLNVVVPAGAPSGASVPVVVTAGSVTSQNNATVAIQ